MRRQEERTRKERLQVPEPKSALANKGFADGQRRKRREVK